MLNKAGNLTVFAPNDEAFGKLSKIGLVKLVKNKNMLLHFLKGHVLPTKVFSKNLKEGRRIGEAIGLWGDMVTNLNGIKLMVVKKGAIVTITFPPWELGKENHPEFPYLKSKVVNADIMASNGVVHIVDWPIVTNYALIGLPG